MKHIIIAAFLFVGCGADDGMDTANLIEAQRSAAAPSPSEKGMVSFLVKSEKELPDCVLENEGALAYIVSIEQFYSCSDETWLLADIRGEKGDRGERGLQGENGQDGRDGATGATGATGAQGVAGERGTDGQDGTDGRDGRTVAVRASSVAQGATCPAGGWSYQPYYTDDNSDVGVPSVVCNGATGATGAQGPQGVQGIQGETGATGAQGAQGIQGETGATGATGAQGAQGVAGADGADGQDGISVGITVSAATAGQCPAGGSVFQPYLDTDRDGVQDAGESTIGSVQVICNGSAAELVPVSLRVCTFAAFLPITSYVGDATDFSRLAYSEGNSVRFEITTFSNGLQYRSVFVTTGNLKSSGYAHSRWENSFPGVIKVNLQNWALSSLNGITVVDDVDFLHITYLVAGSPTDPAYGIHLYDPADTATKVMVDSVTWESIPCTTTDY
jgi:hypothetical protein